MTAGWWDDSLSGAKKNQNTTYLSCCQKVILSLLPIYVYYSAIYMIFYGKWENFPA